MCICLCGCVFLCFANCITDMVLLYNVAFNRSSKYYDNFGDGTTNLPKEIAPGKIDPNQRFCLNFYFIIFVIKESSLTWRTK